MRATIGDRLVIKGHRIGEPDTDAEILEVRGENGAPPYLVRWWDTGRVTLMFPGPDAFIEHHEPEAATSLRRGRAKARR